MELENSRQKNLKVGSLVRARDLQDNWYKSRVIEIDEINQRAKVHFFGWNSRYDQWFDINSNDLKEIPAKSIKQEVQISPPSTMPETLEYDKITDRFDLNEKVSAKWTDNYYYTANIIKHLRRNKTLYYEVRFEDGMKRIVRYDNVKAYDEALEKQVIVPNKLVTIKEETVDKQPISITSAVDSIETTTSDTRRSGRTKRVRQLSSDFVSDPFLREFPVKKHKISEKTPGAEPLSGLKSIEHFNSTFNTSSMNNQNVHRQELVDSVCQTKIPAIKLRIPKMITQPVTMPAVNLKNLADNQQDQIIRCIFPNCDKTFRKQHLLDYHIKYHHYEDGRIIEKNVKKLKTNNRDARKTTSAEQTNKTEIDDICEPYEVIHCTCHRNTSNGFMIQCDVCLCWQHGDCVNVTEANAPSTYLCWICTKASISREKHFKMSKKWSEMLIKRDKSQPSQTNNNTDELTDECSRHYSLLKQLNSNIDCKVAILKNENLTTNEYTDLLKHCEELQDHLKYQLDLFNKKHVQKTGNGGQ